MALNDWDDDFMEKVEQVCSQVDILSGRRSFANQGTTNTIPVEKLPPSRPNSSSVSHDSGNRATKTSNAQQSPSKWYERYSSDLKEEKCQAEIGVLQEKLAKCAFDLKDAEQNRDFWKKSADDNRRKNEEFLQEMTKLRTELEFARHELSSHKLMNQQKCLSQVKKRPNSSPSPMERSPKIFKSPPKLDAPVSSHAFPSSLSFGDRVIATAACGNKDPERLDVRRSLGKESGADLVAHFLQESCKPVLNSSENLVRAMGIQVGLQKLLKATLPCSEKSESCDDDVIAGLRNDNAVELLPLVESALRPYLGNRNGNISNSSVNVSSFGLDDQSENSAEKRSYDVKRTAEEALILLKNLVQRSEKVAKCVLMKTHLSPACTLVQPDDSPTKNCNLLEMLIQLCEQMNQSDDVFLRTTVYLALDAVARIAEDTDSFRFSPLLIPTVVPGTGHELVDFLSLLRSLMRFPRTVASTCHTDGICLWLSLMKNWRSSRSALSADDCSRLDKEMLSLLLVAIAHEPLAVPFLSSDETCTCTYEVISSVMLCLCEYPSKYETCRAKSFALCILQRGVKFLYHVNRLNPELSSLFSPDNAEMVCCVNSLLKIKELLNLGIFLDGLAENYSIS